MVINANMLFTKTVFSLPFKIMCLKYEFMIITTTKRLRQPIWNLAILFIMSASFSQAVHCDTSTTAGNTASWQLVKEEDGIKVFLGEVVGSQYKAYRGEAVINAELNSLLALMDDTKACVDWMLNCKNPILLHKVSMIERYIYQVNNLPWPVNDRDMVLHVLTSQDARTRAVTISIQGVKAEDLSIDIQRKIPGETKNVRVENLKGFWKFIPLGGNRTRAIYQMHVELGGILTPTIVNVGVIRSPIKTIQNMREWVQLDKYRCYKPF